jgi:DNA-binding NarL/FixJ family response regulator
MSDLTTIRVILVDDHPAVRFGLAAIICEDPDGAIWIGTDSGLSRFHQGAFQNFNIENGLAYGSIRAL